MQRLLVTVAFSALVLGVASTGLHAQTSGTTSPTPSMSSGKTGTTTQSNSSMSSSQSGSSMSSSDTKSSAKSSAPAKTAQKTTTTKSSAKKDMSGKTSMSSSQDHVADDLNRQSLNQMGGAQSSYGSSGSTMAPSSTTTTGSAPAKR